MKNPTSDNTVRLTAGNSRQSDISICFWGCSTDLGQSPVAPVSRDHFLMLYCTSGVGVIGVNGSEFNFEVGQFMILFPNQTLSFASASSEPWGLIWVGLKGTFLSYYLQKMGVSANSPLFPWRNSEFILHELSRILNSEDCEIPCDIMSCSAPKMSTGGELERLSCVYSILAEAYRTSSVFAELNTDDSEQEDYIHKATAFIEANYNRKIKISDVAKHVGLNRSYLFTLFKENLNESPQEFLTRLRIRKACDLLRSQNANVSSVAYSLGYEPRAFSRLFKQMVGITPIEFRTRALNGDELP